MFRYGENRTRYTRDVDTARISELDDYIAALEKALEQGWNGFTGTLVKVEPAKPKDVPAIYVMAPFDVKLSYCGRPWQTVRVEIGHNEIGDAVDGEPCLPQELSDAFEQLSFPFPRPLPVMNLSYQIAQKLHAVSEEGSERAHDLIDLQLIVSLSDLNLADLRLKCVRLFDYRRAQAWPPHVKMTDTWDAIYNAALETVRDKSSLLPNVSEAVDWVNRLIEKIDKV